MPRCAARRAPGLAVAAVGFVSALPRLCLGPTRRHLEAHSVLAPGLRKVPATTRRSPIALRARGEKSPYQLNEDILYLEVCLVGEATANAPGVVDLLDEGEVFRTKDILEHAMGRGMDLILIDERAEVPLVVIADAGRYIYREKRARREQGIGRRRPGIKEVKLGYTVGEHDLQVFISRIKWWVRNSAQQVKVSVVLPGRSKMFAPKAKLLLRRVQEEVAEYARSGSMNADPIFTEGKGLAMMLNPGQDERVMRRLQHKKTQEDEDGHEEEGKEEDADGDRTEAPPELPALEAEIEALRQELLSCGIEKKHLYSQPEMKPLLQRKRELWNSWRRQCEATPCVSPEPISQ